MIRETVKIFSEDLEERLKFEDRCLSAWETEFMLAILDDLENNTIELRSTIRNFLTNADDTDGKNVMDSAVTVGIGAMKLFSMVHPLAMHNRRGRSIHHIPRMEAENHLIWDQKNRKECGK